MSIRMPRHTPGQQAHFTLFGAPTDNGSYGVRGRVVLSPHTFVLRIMLRFFQHLAAALALFLAAGAPSAFAAKKEAPPVLAASAYPAHDTHDKEHVTIAAEPFDTRAKGEFFRNDYAGHSILPVRLVIQNDSDAPLDLNQARMQFIAADGTKLPAATPEELNRRLFRFTDIKQKRIPGTPITYKPTPVDKKILDDDKDFSFSQTVIPPHSSASGFLFYDIKEVDDPPLQGAELYVKMIHAKEGTKDDELFGFSVPFDKFLATEKAKKDAEKAAASAKADADGKAPGKPSSKDAP